MLLDRGTEELLTIAFWAVGLVAVVVLWVFLKKRLGKKPWYPVVPLLMLALIAGVALAPIAAYEVMDVSSVHVVSSRSPLELHELALFNSAELQLSNGTRIKLNAADGETFLVNDGSFTLSITYANYSPTGSEDAVRTEYLKPGSFTVIPIMFEVLQEDEQIPNYVQDSSPFTSRTYVQVSKSR